MKPNGNSDSDDPTFKTRGRKLTLVGSMPKADDLPPTRLYKCASCQEVIAIPPVD